MTLVLEVAGMSYDKMSVMSLLCAYAEWAMCEESDKRIGEEFVIIESALRKAVVREASVTWTRKYSLANASGVSCLVGKFPNGLSARFRERRYS